MTTFIFAQLNPEGDPVEVPAFGGFTTYRKRIEDEHDLVNAIMAMYPLGAPEGTPMPQIGDPVLFERKHAPTSLAEWSDEDLGVNLIQKLEVVPPAGKVLSAYELVLEEGEIVVQATFEDEVVRRRELPKSLVMERVFAAGKSAEVKALFDASFELHAKWFSPDWPNVYVDDQGLLTALAAIGCTEAEVATITAPLA